jgi:hypothetical protein
MASNAPAIADAPAAIAASGASETAGTGTGGVRERPASAST